MKTYQTLLVVLFLLMGQQPVIAQISEQEIERREAAAGFILPMAMGLGVLRLECGQWLQGDEDVNQIAKAWWERNRESLDAAIWVSTQAGRRYQATMPPEKADLAQRQMAQATGDATLANLRAVFSGQLPTVQLCQKAIQRYKLKELDLVNLSKTPGYERFGEFGETLKRVVADKDFRPMDEKFRTFDAQVSIARTPLITMDAIEAAKARKDVAGVARGFESLAARGDSRTAQTLGDSYLNGQYVSRDPRAAQQAKANANEKFLVSCPISAGDSIAKVKEFFQISEDPKRLEQPTPGGTYYSYRFPAYGIYIFFDDAKLVKSLRFDPPFAGKIDGVSIGDTREQVLSLKGEPTKRFEGLPDKQAIENGGPAFLRMEAWLYKISEQRGLRYHFGSQSKKVVVIISDEGTAELAGHKNHNPVLERLRSAQVTHTRFGNGAVFTEYKFAGSLQPNFDLDCVSISDLSSAFNPPALIFAAKKCFLKGEYLKAWELFTTGNGFAYYDLKRLSDISTQGALSVLTMNTFNDLSDEKRTELSKTFKEIQADPGKVNAYCSELKRIGPPTYEPKWAILHGIGAYKEPRNGDYLTNVDTAALWTEVVKNRCTVKTN